MTGGLNLVLQILVHLLAFEGDLIDGPLVARFSAGVFAFVRFALCCVVGLCCQGGVHVTATAAEGGFRATRVAWAVGLLRI